MYRINPPASLLQCVNNHDHLLLKHLIFVLVSPPYMSLSEDNNYFHVSAEMMADIKKVLHVNILCADVLVRSD